MLFGRVAVAMLSVNVAIYIAQYLTLYLILCMKAEATYHSQTGRRRNWRTTHNASTTHIDNNINIIIYIKNNMILLCLPARKLRNQ